MLMAHVDSELTSETQLGLLPDPRALGSRHQPVPHQVLVRAIQTAAAAEGYGIGRQQFALGRRGRRLFGVMDLVPPVAVTQFADRGFSIGFRNSTDETLAIKMVAGVRVFVCDNLALSGDLIALNRRNTSGLDLKEAMAEAFRRYLVHASALNTEIDVLQRWPLSPAEAKARIVDLFTERLLPLRLFRAVAQNYFTPTDAMPDCQPRTMWGLHNACTRAIKALKPARRFLVNIGLGKAFGLCQ